jgi:hypothetical protein
MQMRVVKSTLACPSLFPLYRTYFAADRTAMRRGGSGWPPAMSF